MRKPNKPEHIARERIESCWSNHSVHWRGVSASLLIYFRTSNNWTHCSAANFMGGAIILKLSAHNRHIVSFLKMQKTWAISHNSNPNTKSKPLRHFNKIPDDSVMGNERTTLVSVQFSSVAQSSLTLCDHMDCSTPGFPVHHQLPELTQTHVHWVGDDIQPSHSLLSPSPPAFNRYQHQGLFHWVSSLHQVARVLEFQLQH